MRKVRAINRVKRPDSAGNARPRKIAVIHGGTSALRHAAIDLRTRVGRAYRAHCQALTAHVGGDPSVAQQALIDQAGRLRQLARIAWDELERGGVFRHGEPRPALEAYRKVAADEREVLRLLGLQRQAKQLPSLHDLLRERADQEQANGESHET